MGIHRLFMRAAPWSLAVLLCACDPAAPTQPVATPPPSAGQPAPDIASAAQEASGDRVLPGSAGTRRFALVFGNSAYPHGDALVAPVLDARLIANALQARGYTVLLGLDRDLQQMREDIAAFQAMAEGADMGVLYFAGHGFEFDNTNYLMPVDLPTGIADLDEQAVRTHALRLDRLLWELEQDLRVLVAIVDACRVPPMRGEVALPGLAAEEPPAGTILAFSTSPGRLATDSLRAYGVDEEHSPYTYYLADALQSPDVEHWDEAFRVAYGIVNDRTGGLQQPWMNARINVFPAIGPLASPAGSKSPLGGFGVSPERRASGRYWASEDAKAWQLARDRTTTDDELQARARTGDALAGIALASRLFDSDMQRAAGLLEPIAEQGNALAQRDLGTLLWEMAANDSKGRDARHWWVQASAQGIGEARAKLAMIDTDGTDGLEELMRGLVEHHEAITPAGNDRP